MSPHNMLAVVISHTCSQEEYPKWPFVSTLTPKLGPNSHNSLHPNPRFRTTDRKISRVEPDKGCPKCAWVANSNFLILSISDESFKLAISLESMDEVIPHLDPTMVPSTVDPDSAAYINQSTNKSKKQVKISAWKLAKLDSTEAMRAAAKARASSSVLRPIDKKPPSDLSSSASVRTSTSIESGVPVPREAARKSPLGHSYPHSLASQDDYYESGTGTATPSSFSSPIRGTGPEPRTAVGRAPVPVTRPVPVPSVPTTQLTNPMFQTVGAPFIRDARGRASVVWDQEAGRYVSVMATTRSGPATENTPRLVNPIANANPVNHYGRSGQNAVTSAVPAPAAAQERLMYTGQSIFFGGPLLAGNASDTVGDNRRVTNEGIATRERQEVGRFSYTRGEVRAERGRAADMFPIFVPGGLQNNPSSSMK